MAEKLAVWDPKPYTHLNSIVLVPILLAMLRAENVHFQYRGSAQLEKQRAESPRMAASSPTRNKRPSSILYFLEVDMDVATSQRLGDGRSHCAISRSPSPTVALLLAPEVCDEDCKAYLSSAIKATNTRGGVPGVFPPSLFEAAYVS